MQQHRMSSRMRTGAWVLFVGLAAQAGYEWLRGQPLVSWNFEENLHFSAARVVREMFVGTPQAPSGVRVLSDVSFREESSTPEWLEAAALASVEWQRALDSLADSVARQVLVVHPAAEKFAAAVTPNPKWARLTLPSLIGRGEAPGDLSFSDLTEPIGPFTHLVKPAANLASEATTGHLGPWSSFGFWPLLGTKGKESSELSRHFIFASQPMRGRELNAVRLGSRWVNLAERQTLYALPLPTKTLAQVTSSLREFASNPEPFLSSLQPTDVVIVQERKLWPQSASLAAELATVAGLVSAASSGAIIAQPAWAGLYLVFMALATLVCAFLLAPRHFLVVSVVVLGLQIAVQPFLLAFYGILVPWSQLAFVFLPAALVGGLIGERQNRLTKIITMNSLRPAFSESSAKILARVVAAKEDENMTRERIVTLVNIDVVGFAKTIENTLPEESTRQISSFLEIIFDLVHKHGGFVSDYSPDHILAVFGHGLGAKRAKTERNHVRVALQCATEIQAKSVELMHVLGTGVSSPFPVRIAINSSMVRLGLVQIGEKVEFKTIGAGVALARQLSSHCEPFRILLSSSSAEILKVDAGEPMASLGLARSIGTDSSPELLTVFELDPFADDRELLDKATDIYRSYNNIKREDNRFAFPRGAEPLLRSHLGNFEVLDFSLTGMRLKSATYLSAGSVFQAWPAEFDAASPEFKMNLTVHWGAPDKASPTGREKFFLGVRYSGHSPEELAAMVAYFHKQLALCNDGVGELPRAETEEDWAS